MSDLHEVVYHIVLNPHVLTDFIQNSQVFVDKFNLSHNEAAALKSVFVSHDTLPHLLSPETLKQVTQELVEKTWIPSTL